MAPLYAPHNGAISQIRTVAAMRRGDRTRGLAVAAMATALMTGTIASGAQATTTGTERTADERGVEEEVLQNNPNGSSKYEIRERLVHLINEATMGSDITIASYHFDDEKIAERLDYALKRGVRVRVLVDAGDRLKPAYRTLLEAIESSQTSPDSWITTCGVGDTDQDNDGEPDDTNKATSCMGRHIMHNKFFLFENTDDADDVVVQTSANLNAYSGYKMWNTAYITSDEWLYGKYLQYFDDLAEHAPPSDPDDGDSDYYNTFRTEHAPVSHGKFKMYVSPRAEGNTFLDVLNDVRCHGNTSGGTEGDNRTIVRVAALQIAGANGRALAKRLWELDNQGCYVDIVANEIKHQSERGGDKQPLEYLLARPEALPPDRVNYHGPEVREFSSSQCGVHQKNILIDGNYEGKRNQKVVFTGSHNMNNKSPRYNDEVVLRITDSTIHQDIKKHFFDLRAGAAITWQTSKFDVEPKRDPEYNC